jgi:hypothetical protein
MKIRRPSTSFFASIAVHIVVIAFFVQALMMERPLFDLFGQHRSKGVGPVEHIGFLELPTTKGNPAAALGRSGGNGRPERAHTVAPVIAPPAIPSRLPTTPTPSDQTTDFDPGTGPLIGGGGQLRGVQPSYHDPRLWGQPDAVATAPKTSAQQLDSVIAGDIGAYNDSMRVAATGRKDPTDWTVTKNGQKYGVDQKYIHLGPVSIPTAILALLPLNVTGNPTVSQRERAYNAMHNEIFEHAQSAMNETDFQKAVRAIRIRKDRERREREQQKAAGHDGSTAAPSAPSQPTTVAGPETQ